MDEVNVKDEMKKLGAEKLKDEGNELYKQKNYQAALLKYSAAIEMSPEVAPFYGNRAACYMMLDRYTDALTDSIKSVTLDPEFTKGFLRKVKCHMALGDLSQAHRALDRVKELDPSNTVLKDELARLTSVESHLKEVDKHEKKADHRTAVFHMDRILEKCPHSVEFRLRKAENLTHLGQYSQAHTISTDIIRQDSYNVMALFVRGLVLYYQGNDQKAIQHMKQALNLNPEHAKSRETLKRIKALNGQKDAGNEALKAGKLDEALKLYTEALTVDPSNKSVNAKLYFNRSIVYAKKSETKKAIDDCTSAINLEEGYLKAYLKRAQLYMDSEKYQEAVRDYEFVLSKEKTALHTKLLNEAKAELKRSKKKDYYKILGVSKTATEDEIKKAYKKRALLHHPDRHSHASEEVRDEEEKKFKDVNEAYSVLADKSKRSKFDSGVWDDGTAGSGADMSDFANIDPNNIFNIFFGGGGGGGGGQRFTPGGFHHAGPSQHGGFNAGNMHFNFNGGGF